MAKMGYKILAIFFAILLLPGCDSEGNKMSPPASGHSETINDSKENGVFQFEVVADKSNLILDNGLKISIKEAWVENEWESQAYVVGKRTIEKFDSTHQLI